MKRPGKKRKSDTINTRVVLSLRYLKGEKKEYNGYPARDDNMKLVKKELGYLLEEKDEKNI